MLRILASLTQPTGLHVDNARRCIWIVLADGTLGRVGFDGGSLAIAQVVPIRAVDIAANASTLVIAARNGGLWMVDADQPGSAAARADSVKGNPLQVAAGRGVKPVLLTVARTTKRTTLTTSDLKSGAHRDLLRPRCQWRAGVRAGCLRWAQRRRCRNRDDRAPAHWTPQDRDPRPSARSDASVWRTTPCSPLTHRSGHFPRSSRRLGR